MESFAKGVFDIIERTPQHDGQNSKVPTKDRGRPDCEEQEQESWTLATGDGEQNLPWEGRKCPHSPT